MLNLPEFEIVKREENEYYYKFTIVAKYRPFVCTQCLWDESPIMGDTKRFSIHSSKERQLFDIPIHGKPVVLILKHNRYKCPCCNKTFYQPFHAIERNDKVTLRLKHYIQQQSLRKPFLEVGYDCGLSHTSVRKYFKEEIARLDAERNIKAPRVLGIDEAHLNKKMRGVFTDTENNKLLEITEDNLKRTVKHTIQNMEGYEDIEVVTIDMWSGYRYACRELIPKATVVVDKFHVVQYANNALDKVRKELKHSLCKDRTRILRNDRWVLLKNKEDLSDKDIILRDTWFEEFPELGVAYWLKETLRDIYIESKDRYEAFQRFYEWECRIPDDFKAFKDLQNTYNNNKQEIFNYFLQPYTNAYTESINNVIKSIEKAGKGYSYEVLRAKVLYGTNATKRPKFTKDMKMTMLFKAIKSIEYKPKVIELEGFEVDLDEFKINL